jgi:hypothetical protein
MITFGHHCCFVFLQSSGHKQDQLLGLQSFVCFIFFSHLTYPRFRPNIPFAFMIKSLFWKAYIYIYIKKVIIELLYVPDN